ncbi:MAG TPA: tetratricopeptide repeat protein, partial [Sandaracinaceae bacterium]
MGAASQELTERAKLLISERRYQEAVRACRRALLSQPDQVEVRLLLGEALLALQRYDEVRVEMMALARKLPGRAEVHRILGEAYLRDHRPTQAIESLRRALELDPNDEIAKELLAEAADERPPVSTTIERWFAEEAAPTVETAAPAWIEETTPVPATLPEARPSQLPPSVEIDPSLTQPAKRLATIGATKIATETRGPRIRSKKPTMAGYPGAYEAPLPPPPVRSAIPAPVSPERLSPPPPAAAPRAELPREATSAQRPSAMRHEPPTDELELTSIDEPLDESELEPADAFEHFAPIERVPDDLSG